MTNDFVPFAGEAVAPNILSQPAYLGDPQRLPGAPQGIARRALNNKALRQATAMSAAVAQAVADISGLDMLDDGDTATQTANVAIALAAATSAFSTSLAGVSGSTLVGFKQAGASTVTYSLQAKSRQQVSLMDWGCACNGVANDTALVQAAIADIGASVCQLIIPGPTLINAALTFGSGTELVFTNNGKIVGTAGTEVIQVQRQIVSGRGTCFATCIPSATTAMTVFPEWFGAVKNGTTGDQAAFIAAYYFLRNTGGVIAMAPGVYALTAPITGVKSKVALVGAGYNITVLLQRTANTAGIQAYGASIADKLLEVAFLNFTLRLETEASAGCFGIDFKFCRFPYVDNVEIAGFLYGHKVYQASNGIHRKVHVSYQGTTNGFIAFIIDGDGGLPSNASSVYDLCWWSGNANISNPAAAGSIGIRATGAYLADLEFRTPQGTQTNIAMYFDASAAGAACVDITIYNPVLDQFLSQGLVFNGFGEQGAVSVIGGWINAKNVGTQTDDIYIVNSRGITIAGACQIFGTDNANHARGIVLSNSYNITVSPCTRFRDCKYGIVATGSAYNRFSGSFYNTSGIVATAYISMTGDARSFITGGMFDGYATQAIIIDGTSTASGVIGCGFDVANIVTRITNNSAGAIGGVNGSTGLNSGI